MNKLLKTGSRDIFAALKGYELAGLLGWQDIRQRYRRSSLGPFWLTISMGVLIGALGLVFGTLFASSMREFLPFLTSGLILWTLITTSLNDGCMGFTAAEAMIKQISLPLFTHILRVLWRNLIIFAHNIVILPLVLLIFWIPLQATAFLSILGLVLLMINLSWMALLLSVFCTRFRDVPQIIGNLLQVFFYVTPIIWMPQMLPKRASIFLLDANPFFHLIEIVRAPLLGGLPSLLSWQVSFLLALAGWIFTILFYGRFRSRIAYWL
ncbi:MAG: ABC transporter permease [Syntrophaceae bacterium]|nr:ABC transporter permease [Syntrophaceae bacterium]